jgi:hypothetical protein
LILVALFFAAVGFAGWYYFFGRKPVVAMSVSLSVNGDQSQRGLWPAGPKQLLLYADGEVKLVDLHDGKVKWSVKMPPQPKLDPTWQEAVNFRFVKLQQWADELGRARATLTTDAAIKAFNAEAGRYHEELNAARSEAANPREVAPQASVPAAVAPPTQAVGGDQPGANLLHPVVDAQIQILEERVKKRAAKLDAWRSSLDAKKANAKTDLQRSAAREEETKYESELAAQKREQDELQRSKAVPVVASPAEPKAAPVAPAGDSGMSKPAAAVCGEQIWVVEGRHAVAFDRASGAVKADVRLAGAARQGFPSGDAFIVVASAGAEAVQLTRLTAAAAPQSMYLRTGRHESAFVSSGQGVVPTVQAQRSEFSGAGGGFLRADIRLKEKKIAVRAGLKPDSDKELESAADKASAHSADEIKAISSLIANDAARLSGATMDRVDESTYEVALRRPFNPDVPEWTGILRGRVQLFSTPTIDLVTAGTKLLAFDRANKKLWEATLGAPVPVRRSDEEWDALPPPWLESGERLFFADGAFLSALHAKTGQVLWRLPSVGIRKLQIDSDGHLYVLSDNLRVEALTYAFDDSLRGTAPLTMKLGGADGKIAWQVEKYQNVWVSGKDVYVLRETRNGADVENQAFDPRNAIEARIKIYKLSRGSGSPMWEWFQTRRAQKVEADQKHVALLFGDELQVIRSISW